MLLPKQPTISLQNLYEEYVENRKNRKRFPKLCKQTKSAHIQQIGSFSVASPFSKKNCNLSKDKCKCPFHSYQRFSNVQTHQLPHLRGFTEQEKENHQKLNRQSSEMSVSLKRQYKEYFGGGKVGSTSAHISKFKKNIIKTQNYDHITHKVNCRNAEFQQFLNKNQRFTLKKNHNSPDLQSNSQEQDTIQISNLEIFLKYIEKSFEQQTLSSNILQSQQGLSSKKILNKSLKKGIKNSSIKTILPSDLVKIKLIVDEMKCNKKIKGQSIKRLSIVLTKFANQEERLYGHSLAYKELRQLVEQLKLIEKDRGKNTKSRKKIEKSRKSLKSTNEKIDFSRSSKRAVSSSSLSEVCHSSKLTSQITIIPKQSTTKKGTHRRPSIFSSSKMLKKRNKQTKTLLNLYSHKDSPKKKPQTNSQEQKTLQNTQNNQQINSLNIEQKMKNRFLSSFRNSKMSFLNMKSKMNSMIMENSNIQEASFKISRVIDEEELIEAIQMGGVKYQRFHEVEKQKEKMKEKKLRQQLEIQAHLRRRQEQEEQEKLRLKRRIIEKNENFLAKFRKKMTQELDLQILVVQDNDSLITQKKKIRFLKEMLAKAKATQKDKSNEIYEEIGKYVDFYTHHFNLVLGKDTNELENVDISSEQNLGSVVRPKDYNSSLKFIALEHNQKKEKQQKVDGWISIPQYTTVYSKKKRAVNESRKEQKPRESQEKPRRREQEVVEKKKQESILLQRDLEQKMVVKEEQEIHYEAVIRKGSSLKKRSREMVNFEEKIDFYRRKILKRYRTEQNDVIECT